MVMCFSQTDSDCLLHQWKAWLPNSDRGGRATFPGRSFCSHVRNRLQLALPFAQVILARINFSIRRFVSAAMANPRCYFDITIGGKATGRIIFEVSTLSSIVHVQDLIKLSCMWQLHTHTAHSFLRPVFSLYLFVDVLHLCCQLILSFVICSSERMWFQRLQVCIKLA